MSRNPCEEFEITIEMRRHGAADAAALVRLDAHLLSCEACRSYERLAGGTDEALQRRTGEAESRMDWKGLRRKVSAGRENFVHAGFFAAALWSVVLGILWLVRFGALKTRIFDPLPQVLPVLVLLTTFGLGMPACWILWVLDRRRTLRKLASPEAVLSAYRRDIGKWLRVNTWVFRCVLLLVPVLVFQWLRWRGPLDGHAAFSLLCQICLVGLNLYLYLVQRPRLLREDAELSRFDTPPDGAA